MDITDIVAPGDWILPIGVSVMGKLIDKITFGKVNHAAIVYDKSTVFETDGSWFKAKFNSLPTRYQTRQIIIVHPKYLYPEHYPLLQALCKKYEGSPYSYWNILTQAIFSPLHPMLREKLIRWTGTKKFMICSELVARIMFELSGRKEFRDFEGMNPEDLRQIAMNNPEMYKIRYWPQGINSKVAL